MPVFGESYAKAVDDAPAGWRHKPQIDAVFVGEDGIAVFFKDLQLVHAGREDGAERHLAAGEEGDPAGEQLLALGFPRHVNPD